VGGYNCTFNKRAIFVYRCRSDCEGYTIRKEFWNEIIENEEYADITHYVKQNIREDYIENIKTKVLRAKGIYMAKI